MRYAREQSRSSDLAALIAALIAVVVVLAFAVLVLI
jgi:hypothetical protein